MNIAGVLVHARPGQADAVKGRLLSLPGVEVHAVTEEGRMVVTVEELEDTDSMSGNTMLRLQDVEGVVSASMIYHHCEE